MIYDMKVIDLLKENLPKKYVDAVIKNVRDKAELNEDAESLEVELLSLFDWDESPEGFEFWSEVLNSVLMGDPLPDFKDIRNNRRKAFYIDYAPGTTIFTDGHIRVFNVSGVGIDIKLEYSSIMARDSFPEVAEKYYCSVN